VVPTDARGVVAIMQTDERTLVPKLEGKKEDKSKSGKQNQYGKKKKIVEEPPQVKVRSKPRKKSPEGVNPELYERSMNCGWYPPREGYKGYNQ
jgi:hypothetical protein